MGPLLLDVHRKPQRVAHAQRVAPLLGGFLESGDRVAARVAGEDDDFHI